MNHRPVYTRSYAALEEIPIVCTVRETALILRMSEDWIKKKLQSGAIRGKKVGKEWRICKSDILEYLGIENA